MGDRLPLPGVSRQLLAGLVCLLALSGLLGGVLGQASLPEWRAQPEAGCTWTSAVPPDVAGVSYQFLSLKPTPESPVVVERDLAPDTQLPQAAAVLCLNQGGDEPIVTVSAALCAGDESPGEGVAVSPDEWQAIPIARPVTEGAGAGAERLAVRVTSEAEATVSLVVVDPLAPMPPPVFLEMIGNYCLQQGQNEIALSTWEQYEAVHAGTVMAARGLLGQGDALRNMERADEAIGRYRTALGPIAVPDDVPLAPQEPVAGYFANRVASDTPSAVHGRLLPLVPSLADRSTASALLKTCAATWPPTPDSKSAALQLARTQTGAAETQSVHDLISVFCPPADRTTPHTTKLPDNQLFLNNIASVTDAALLTEGLTLLTRALPPDGVEAPANISIEAVVAEWQEAEKAALRRDRDECVTRLRALASDCPNTIVADLATMAAARTLHYAGRYTGALGAQQEYQALADGNGPMATHGRLGLAELAFGGGRYGDALPAFAGLAGNCPDGRIRAWTAFRTAQCLEFQGRWDEAIAQYELAAGAPSFELAEEASFAPRRVSALQDKHQPAETPTVQYLGEDRSTQGDWYTYYGSRAFVLCGQQAPNDIAGGPESPWGVTARPGHPEEETRHWVTSHSDAHRSMLYNPLSRVRRAANWDDRGEAYHRGAGPDLWLDVSIPEGPQRLSLYFVNDHNYYEPRRVYTVSVFDQKGKYQTGTEVRFFVNGLYKQFSATGPSRLRILISRNLSMNVVLAGVFLDPLSPPEIRKLPGGRGAARAWGVWQAERGRHLSSADERAAFSDACAVAQKRARQRTLAKYLEELTEGELAARRFGPAAWAAEARADLLADDRAAALGHLQDAVGRFSTSCPLQAPHVTSAVVQWPIVRSLFVRYLEVGRRGLSREQVQQFYRSTAEAFGHTRPRLAAIAHDYLAAMTGEPALSPDDHYDMTFTATDQEADAARLERLLASGRKLENRAELQMLLLGRYLGLGQPEKAEALVAEMQQADPAGDTTANAVYNLAVHHQTRSNPDAARERFQKVIDEYPDSHWAEYARKRIADLPEPTADTQPEQ